MINILAAAYGTVGDIEILFSLLAFVGASFSAFALHEAIGDYNAIKNAGIGNGRRLLAWSSIHAEAGRLIIQLVFLALGIMAMFIGETPQQNLPLLIVVFGYVFRWGLIFSTGLLMYKSVLSYYVRRQLKQERLSNGVSSTDPLERPVRPSN